MYDASTAAEQIDRLISCDLQARTFFPALYAAARAVQDGPLCLLAANRLREALEDTEAPTILFVTGFFSPILGVGEQDGPVGTTYLARVLEQAFGAVPLVVTDGDQIDLVTQTLRGGGFNVIPPDRAIAAARHGKGKAASVLAFPHEPKAAAREAERLLVEIRPRALVAIERPGANAAGIPHSLGAMEIGDITAPTDELLRVVRNAGCPSIAIGDAGNELGCGKIHAEIARILGEERRCPTCQESIAAFESADVLVMAAVSNWGAYGVAAALALILDAPRILPDIRVLEWTLRACGLAGGRNGMSDWTDPGSDGLPLRVDLGVLAMLRALVGAHG